MITITSLVHPTMIVKIREGLKHAALGNGHKMGGHGNRVYIANRKGHNIMRIDWKGQGKFVAYGGADWGRTEVTEIVKAAIQRGCSANRVKPRQFDCDKPSEAAKAQVASSPSLKARLIKLAAMAGIVLAAGTSATVQANELKPNRTVTDGKLFAEIYASCMNAVVDPGVFIEESCRASAKTGSQIEIQWDETLKVWVRAVQI